MSALTTPSPEGQQFPTCSARLRTGYMWAVDAHQVAPATPAMRWTPRRLLPASDDGLARMVAAGNEDAFAALYGRYHQRLYRYCRSMLGKDEDAQDALQSTFAGAYAALAQGRRDAPMRPWLYRIAHNESVSVMRRRRPEMEISEDVVPPAASAAEVAAERGRLALLMADLAALTERQRGALVMRELGGLSHAEIAAALTIDESGAKQTIFEARRSLHEFAEGRAMVCEEVCRAISTGGGRTLRGRKIRAHLRECQGCQAFADAIPSRTKSLHALAPPLAGAAATSIMRRAIASGRRTQRWRRGRSRRGHGRPRRASVMAVGKALVGAAAVATVAAGATGIVRLAAPASPHRSGAVHHESHHAARSPLAPPAPSRWTGADSRSRRRSRSHPDHAQRPAVPLAPRPVTAAPPPGDRGPPPGPLAAVTLGPPTPPRRAAGSAGPATGGREGRRPPGAMAPAVPPTRHRRPARARHPPHARRHPPAGRTPPERPQAAHRTRVRCTRSGTAARWRARLESSSRRLIPDPARRELAASKRPDPGRRPLTPPSGASPRPILARISPGTASGTPAPIVPDLEQAQTLVPVREEALGRPGPAPKRLGPVAGRRAQEADMTLRGKTQAALAIAALGVVPMGVATAGAAAHPSSSHTTPAQAKAYGRMCAQQGLLKNHRAAVAAGQKRTAYADCVVALAHLAHSTTTHPSAQKACAAAGESKKHVAGHPGTDYSRCVVAGNKLLAAKRHAA